MRFFYFSVVIRRLIIHLHNVLARRTSRIGYGNGYAHRSIAMTNNVVRYIAVVEHGFCFLVTRFYFNVFERPRKIGVRQSVAERILNYGVVSFAVGIFLIVEVSDCVCRFIPLVTDVNIFGIEYLIVAALGAHGVYVGGIGSRIIRRGVGSFARRIDRTRKHFSDGFGTRLPGKSDKKRSVYARLFQKAHFHGVCYVQKHYYRIVIFFYVIYHGTLVLG